MRRYGEKDALYIDDKKVTKGPPLSYEKIKRLIVKRVKKL
jgi:hypothetical protein